MQGEVYRMVDVVRRTILDYLLSPQRRDGTILVKLHDDLFDAVWNKLVAGEAQGGALATASFLPMWELMQQLASGQRTSGVGDLRASLLLLLTSLYGKSKDRRCLFQHLIGCGDAPASAVPLFVPCSEHAVLRSMLGVCSSLPPTLKKALTLLCHAEASGGGPQQSSLAGVQRGVEALTRQALPSCRFVKIGEGAVDGASHPQDEYVVVCDGDDNHVPLRVLQSIVWSTLVQAELVDESSARELRTYLTSSEWARRTVQQGNSTTARTHSSLFTPLIDACAVGMSVNPRAASISADNVPLLHPQLAALFARRAVVSVRSCQSAVRDNLSGRYTLKRSRDVAEHAVMRRVRRMKDNIDTVQSSLAFDPSGGSTLRDVDQLSLMARDILFSPLATHQTASAAGVSMPTLEQVSMLLFDRRPPLHGTATSVEEAEGPALLPGNVEVSEKTSTPTLTVLERFCLSSS